MYSFFIYSYSQVRASSRLSGFSTESEVLLRLCRDAGKTVNTSALLKEFWGDDNYFNLRSLNVYITRLRNHFKTDHTVEIESVRGIGYKLKY